MSEVTCVLWKHSCSPVKSLFFFTLGGDTINTSERQHGKCCNLRMQSRSHVLFIIQAEDDRQMCWTTRGVKVTDQWRATFAYTLEATTKTKAWLGHNFYAKPLRSPSVFCPVLPCPAYPGTFLITIQSLFTLSNQLNELRLRALPGKLCRPHPALTSLLLSLPLVTLPPQTTPLHPSTFTFTCTQTHKRGAVTHTYQLSWRESV